MTGGAGFIGSAIVRQQAQIHPKATIIVLDKLLSCASVENLPPYILHRLSEPIPTNKNSDRHTDKPSIKLNGHAHALQSGAGVYLVVNDVCNLDLVETLVREEKIDTIIHFAAQSHVDNSFTDSLAFTTTNTLGTHVMLEAARVSCGLFVSFFF